MSTCRPRWKWSIIVMMITCCGLLPDPLQAQPRHVPLTMPRQRVIQSCGAALVTSHSSSPFSLSTIVGLTSVGTVRSDRRRIMLGFWMPIDMITSIGRNADIVAGQGVWAWPNPFRDNLTMELSFPMVEFTHADIYNANGSHVASLAPRSIRSDGAEFTWNALDSDGNPVANGLYTVRVTAQQLLLRSTTVFSATIVCNR